MTNREGFFICIKILLVGFVICALIIFLGNLYNKSQEDRLLNGECYEIYVNGIRVEEDFLDCLYLDKFRIRIEGDKAFLSYIH